MSTLRLRGDGLQWRAVEQEILALDGRTSTYLSANGSGALLWRQLADGTTREALVRSLVDTYGIDESTAAADVDRFTEELERHALLDREDATPA